MRSAARRSPDTLVPATPDTMMLRLGAVAPGSALHAQAGV